MFDTIKKMARAILDGREHRKPEAEPKVREVDFRPSTPSTRALGRVKGKSLYRKLFGVRPLKRNRGHKAREYARRDLANQVAKQARKVNR